MTTIITSHGFRFNVEGDGFSRAHASGDFDAGVAAIEAHLDQMDPRTVSAVHFADRAWQSRDCEGDRPPMIDELEREGFPCLDLSHNELAKLHLSHMVGGRLPARAAEAPMRPVPTTAKVSIPARAIGPQLARVGVRNLASARPRCDRHRLDRAAGGAASAGGPGHGPGSRRRCRWPWLENPRRSFPAQAILPIAESEWHDSLAGATFQPLK